MFKVGGTETGATNVGNLVAGEQKVADNEDTGLVDIEYLGSSPSGLSRSMAGSGSASSYSYGVRVISVGMK
jgi:hypothetical protein